MDFLYSLFFFLVLIGVMIIVHELGHFWAARFFKVRVDTFSIGFGPRLFGFKRGDTDYRVSAILFGGYVKMAGEQPGEGEPAHPDNLMAKPRWQRLIVAFAGPFMNIALAIVILTGLYTHEFKKLADDSDGATIGSIIPGSAAEKAGIKEGDKIIAIDGQKEPSWDDVGLKELANSQKAMPVTILRAGKKIETSVTPILDEKIGLGTAGWGPKGEVEAAEIRPGMPAEKAGLKQGDILLNVNGQPIESRSTLPAVVRGTGGKPVTIVYRRGTTQGEVTMRPDFVSIDGDSQWRIGVDIREKLNYTITQLSLPDAVLEATKTTRKIATSILDLLRGLLERRVSGKLLSGPIGIAKMSGDSARRGPVDYLELMSEVSVNLAVFNLLPIPILDGGVILLLLIEMLMGRDLSLAFKENVLKVGFVLLMMVVVFVLYNDISRVFSKG